MHKYFMLLLCTVPILLIAEDQWQPHQHPAFAQRQLTGYSEAIYRLDLAAEVSARVHKLGADVGDRIDDNSVIELDDRLAQIDVQLSKAQLAQSMSNVEIQKQLLLGLERERSFRKKELERIQQLHKQAASSEQQLDSVTFQYDQADIAVKQQTAAITQAEQAVAVATAHLKRSEEMLARHSIPLPKGWTVSQRFVQEQSLVQPGVPLLQLVDNNRLIIRYQLSEQEIVLLQQETQLSVTAQLHNKRVAVKIKSISPDFDPISRKREVVLEADASAYPGASAGITCLLSIRVPDLHGGILIPQRFTNNRFDQLRVQSTDKQWHPILVLRRENDMLVVQADQIPADTTLMIPETE